MDNDNNKINNNSITNNTTNINSNTTNINSNNNLNSINNKTNTNNTNNINETTKKKSFKENIKSKFSNFKSTIGKKMGDSIIVNNPITNNISAISIGIFIFLFVVLMVFFSSNYRTKRSLHFHNSYQRYLATKSYYLKKNINNNILGNHFIASSVNSCNVKNSILGYLSLDVFENVLKSGARYIEIKIFNDKFGTKNVNPIISNGLENGEWKLCLNTILFEDFCKVIQKHAFNFQKVLDNNKIEGVKNPEDPLFLSLDLKVRNNVRTLDEISRIIMKYLKSYLLPTKFRYSRENLFFTKMTELKKKLVIFSSDGFEGSKLKELINANWGEKGKLKRYTYSYLDLLNQEQREVIKKETRENLMIIVPEDNFDKQMDLSILFKNNFNSRLAFDLGAQFNCMNYQKNDENLDDYITRFKNYSILSKPKQIQSKIIKKSKSVKKATYQQYRNKISEAIDILKKINE